MSWGSRSRAQTACGPDPRHPNARRRPGRDAYHGLIDSEAMEQQPSIDQMVEMQMRNQHLDELLKRLSGREEAILRLRYGFYDDKMHTLAEAGSSSGSRASGSASWSSAPS